MRHQKICVLRVGLNQKKTHRMIESQSIGCFTMNWRKSREGLTRGQFLGMILHIPSLCHEYCDCSPETTPTNQC